MNIKREKYFEIENTKYDEQSDFLINLYSQNCQFVVSRNISKFQKK